MKNSIKYTLLGTLLILGSLTFLGAGTMELARTGTFDGVGGMARISDGYQIAYQDAGGGGAANTPNLTPPGSASTLNLTPPGTAPTPSGGLENPLKAGTLKGFLLAILDILLVFALPVIVFFIMYAGFLYVTAQGDPTKIKTAHSALTWSVVGGVIILGAKLIIDVIQNTVNAL